MAQKITKIGLFTFIGHARGKEHIIFHGNNSRVESLFQKKPDSPVSQTAFEKEAG